MTATAGATRSTVVAIGNSERAAAAAETIPDDRWELIECWFAELNLKQQKLFDKFDAGFASLKGELKVIGPRIDTLSTESARLAERVDVLAGLVHRQGNIVTSVVDAMNELQVNAAAPFVEAVDELRRVRAAMERALETMDAQRAFVPDTLA